MSKKEPTVTMPVSMYDRLEARIAQLESSQRWVSASEGLPDIDDGRILVWIESGCARIGEAYQLLPFHENWPIDKWLALPPLPSTGGEG